MEIDKSLYEVLMNCYAIKQTPEVRFTDGGDTVILNEKAETLMKNGITVAKFLTFIALYLSKQKGHKIDLDFPKLQ